MFLNWLLIVMLVFTLAIWAFWLGTFVKKSPLLQINTIHTKCVHFWFWLCFLFSQHAHDNIICAIVYNGKFLFTSSHSCIKVNMPQYSILGGGVGKSPYGTLERSWAGTLVSCYNRRQNQMTANTPTLNRGGGGGGVWISLFSEVTLFEYNFWL